MGPVDVDHVERDGDARDPLGLGDELLGKHGWRNHIEGVDGLDGNRPLPAEPTRGKELLPLVRARGVAGALGQRFDELAASREVPVDGRAGYPGRAGNVGERGGRGLAEQTACRVEYPLTVAARVGAAAGAFVGQRSDAGL